MLTFFHPSTRFLAHLRLSANIDINHKKS